MLCVHIVCQKIEGIVKDYSDSLKKISAKEDSFSRSISCLQTCPPSGTTDPRTTFFHTGEALFFFFFNFTSLFQLLLFSGPNSGYDRAEI